jgi:heat shock protein HslJ
MKVRSIISMMSIIFISSILILSCKPVMQQSSLQAQKLAGTSWLLITGADHDPPEIGQGQATLAFENSRAYGTDGCNRYSGPYAEDKDTLIFSENMIMTKMACLDEVIDQAATDFINALIDTRKFRIEDTVLILIDENNQERARLKGQELE